MYATPNRAVSIVIAVPGDAARRASSPISCETLSEMFGLTTRSFIADAASPASGRSQRRNFPRPFAAFTSGRLQTTSPREIVISGQAESSMPSYGV